MASIYKVTALSLAQTSLFKGWNMDTLTSLSARMQPVLFPPNTVVFTKDKWEEAARFLYVIAKVLLVRSGPRVAE